MNKKIKIIQILDNYADDKEILMPKYVKYFDRIYKADYIMLVCQENIIDKLDKNAIKLNDEVVILEDNTEEIEELKRTENVYDMTLECYHNIEKKISNDELADKINEIIRYIKRKDKNND